MNHILNFSPFQSRRKRHSPFSTNGRSFPIDWILPGQIAVGRLPGASDSESLKRSGVRAVLALCSASEGAWPADLSQHFHCHRIVIPDSHYAKPLMTHHISMAVDHLNTCIEHRLPVFVHCLAGIERSPTICTAYLCRYHKYTLWESLNWVKQVHPDSLPSELQLQVIQDYLDESAHKIA